MENIIDKIKFWKKKDKILPNEDKLVELMIDYIKQAESKGYERKVIIDRFETMNYPKRVISRAFKIYDGLDSLRLQEGGVKMAKKEVEEEEDTEDEELEEEQEEEEEEEVEEKPIKKVKKIVKEEPQDEAPKLSQVEQSLVNAVAQLQTDMAIIMQRIVRGGL